MQICEKPNAQMGDGYYVDRFSHVDVRSWRARWKQIRSGQPTIAVSSFNMPVLKEGSKGEDVKDLQRLLNKYKYGLIVDGIFGPKTKIAVADFQKSKDLIVDGVVGPQTWSALGI